MGPPHLTHSGELDRLAEEQAALREIATALARGAPPAELFSTVAEQVARVLHVPVVSIVRYEDEQTASECASYSQTGELFPVGARWSLDGTNVVRMVLDTRAPARIDDYTGLGGQIAELVRAQGIRSTVGSPIVVAGRVWGAMVVSSAEPDPLDEGTEARLADFTELVATAIANTEARMEVERLAEEQAALRRVATLVAHGLGPEAVFRAVADEVQTLLGAEASAIVRFEPDGTVVVMGGQGGAHAPGTRLDLHPGYLAASVKKTGRPARVDTDDPTAAHVPEAVRKLGIRSSLASPIVIDGDVWGAIAVGSRELLPAGTERRLAAFTELVATAISNAQARGDVHRLAEEQAALRRVATLVAHDASQSEVFTAVAREIGQLLGTEEIRMVRYEDDRAGVVVASSGGDVHFQVGYRVSLESDTAAARVFQTGQPVRIDDFATASGTIPETVRSMGIRGVVAAPISVQGRLWGAMTAGTTQDEPLPPDTESRLGQFTELMAAAIANADARAELVASRARLVAASDEARRRFERDLHDGVQQRLVSLSLELRNAQAIAQSGSQELAEHLGQVATGLAGALDDLRELSRGIHPAILSKGGLVPALNALARRSTVPVQLDLALGKPLADQVEIGAYYVVSEALTNVAKHARASKVEVQAHALDGVLELQIDDDGVGGADPSRGSGLTGLADRVEALGGRIWIASPPGEGTSLRVELSLDSQ